MISFAISEAGSSPSTSGKPPTRERTLAVGAERRSPRRRRRARSAGRRTPRRRRGRGCRSTSVERVEQERDERAVAPEAGAGAPVDRGAVGGGEVARPARARARARTPVPRLGRLGRDASRRARAARRRRVAWRASAAASSSPSAKITLQQREQQPGVGVGVDRHVLERARGLGAARVDDDDAAAALDDRVQLVLDPRRGQHRCRARRAGWRRPSSRKSVRARSGIGSTSGEP